MSDFLQRMAHAPQQRADAARAMLPLAELRSMAFTAVQPLKLDRFDLIAEVKRTSPSAGVLEQPGLDVATQARRYADAGAAMISVLTEPTRFGGSEADLRAVASDVSVPVMRKDFLVDPYQIAEARAWRASAVLLIARILDDEKLAVMLDASQEFGLTVLLEAFDELDIRRSACAINARDNVLLGLNCRDLATLKEDTKRFEALAHSFPEGSTKIAESGIATSSDAAHVAELGYDGVLVGSALMRSDDPGRLARDIIGAGRRARA